MELAPTLTVPIDDAPCISFHTLNGVVVLSTLKLVDFINMQAITVLIDGGSTNNFIQTRLVIHLDLAIQPSPYLWVTISSKDMLSCAGQCLQVMLMLGDQVFPIDLLLLPVFRADVVHCVPWLASLRQIVF